MSKKSAPLRSLIKCDVMKIWWFFGVVKKESEGLLISDCFVENMQEL